MIVVGWAGDLEAEMSAIENLARVMPQGWGTSKSQWLKGGATFAFDHSPFAYHPPCMAESIVSGALTHPLADQVRNLQPGEEVRIPERDIAKLGPEGAEMLHAMVRWAMRDGRYTWEICFQTEDCVIRRITPTDCKPLHTGS
jgi:hypothetical protein